MLVDVLTTPVITFALDNRTTAATDTEGAIPVSSGETSQDEQLNKALKTAEDASSDIYDSIKRVTIPITDKLLPIHYTGGSHQQTHFVDYLDNEAELTRASSITILSFEMKNDVSKLSTVADLILGIADKSFFSSMEPRVSFFSANLCVFNAYLRGISRSVVGDTDKEILSITLETAPNDIKQKTEIEKSKAFTNAVDQPITPVNTLSPFSVGASSGVSVQNYGNFVQITESEIDFNYSWYQVFTLDEIGAIEVPDYTPEFTIERENIRLMRVNSVDLSGALRYMITIEFNGAFTTLKAEQGQSLGAEYGMMIYQDNLYFGVLNES